MLRANHSIYWREAELQTSNVQRQAIINNGVSTHVTHEQCLANHDQGISVGTVCYDATANRCVCAVIRLRQFLGHSPEHRRPYCPTCGQGIISACLLCRAGIPGDFIQLRRSKQASFFFALGDRCSRTANTCEVIFFVILRLFRNAIGDFSPGRHRGKRKRANWVAFARVYGWQTRRASFPVETSKHSTAPRGDENCTLC